MGGKGKGKGKGGGKPACGSTPSFQVKLGGEWKDYEGQEDKILKRAFMAGFPNAKFELRGQHYMYDFKTMKQKNEGSGKERDIRQPSGWTQPSKPIVPPGPTMTVTVPAGAAGQTIQVPHPKLPGQMINVNVPPGAKAGQAMLVPVPATGEPKAEGGGGGAAPAAGGGGWSTGGKVAAGTAAVVGVGGLAVGGALLGTAIAEHGAEATFDGIGDAVGDAAGDAGDWAADAADAAGDWGGDAADAAGDWAGDAAGDAGDWAGDAGDFIVDGADTAGDFIMDLF